MRHILFVELLGGIGDVLIALPAIQALARSHPAAKLTVLTFVPGGELLAHDPLIHHVISIDRPSAQTPYLARDAVATLLAQHPFDLIVSDTNYNEIEQIIQTSGALRVVTNLWRSPPPHQRVDERFLEILLAEELIRSDAIAAPQLHLTPAEQLQAQHYLSHDLDHDLDHAHHPLIVLYIDAGMAIKRWPTVNAIALGRTLQHRYNATVLVPVGSDLEQATQLVRAIGGTAQVLARGTLRQLAALLSHADLMIAPDTGPVRIAAILGVPTITLFGPSWHGRYGQPVPHINLQGYPECPERNISNFTEQRCWYSGTCPLGHWQTCLEAIAPDEVLAAAVTLLDRGRSLNKGTVSPHSNSSLKEPWRLVRNILAMRLDNIGDVLMTSPALRAIKENLPQSRLTLMASPGGATASELLPWVDEVLPWRVLWQDLGKLDFEPEREWRLIKTLRDRHFDAAIIFTSFSQTPHPAGYLCYLAGIPLRLGESKEWGGGVLSTDVKSAPDEIHQVERNLRLIESVGFQVSDRSLAIRIPESAQYRAMQLLSEHGLTADSPYILLNPWTTCQSRNYKLERFAIAARRLAEITGWRVVVTGVEQDRSLSDPLLETLKSDAIDLIGATRLTELAALIAGARLMVSNNTSTMHIADATRTPSVILFAGTEYESQWRPRHTAARLLRQPTPCSPCYAFTCPYHLECLDIPPESVVAAGLELLDIIS
jgi:ADP-heptose:LPS heptosyltransferase